MAIETTVKLAVNVVLSAAVSGLVKLLPYQWSQQQKLWEIQTEVKVEGRVNRLRTDFNRYFDPQKAKSVKSRVKGLLPVNVQLSC